MPHLCDHDELEVLRMYAEAGLTPRELDDYLDFAQSNERVN